MSKGSPSGWQLNVSLGLVLSLLLLIVLYFFQSFQAVRAVAPVEVAVERLKARQPPKSPEASAPSGIEE